VTRRNALFLICSALLAVLFVRLGVWQLHRRSERRARNAIEGRRLSAPPVPLADLPRDPAAARFRRVRVVGRYDFAHELLYTNRIRDGAPGVQVLTPLRPDSGFGGDTVVMIDRGWVYAPDGATIDVGRWREPERLDGVGYVEPFTRSAPGASEDPAGAHPERFRWLDRSRIGARVGRPVAPFYVALAPDTAADAAAGPPRTPVRVPPPPLDEGPHLSYAIQWFSFAVIAIAGALLVVFVLPRRRSPSRGGVA